MIAMSAFSVLSESCDRNQILESNPMLESKDGTVSLTDESVESSIIGSGAGCLSPRNSLASSAAYDAPTSSSEVGFHCDGMESDGAGEERGPGNLNSSYGTCKPHKGRDTRWEAIRAARTDYPALGLEHFRLLKPLGCGDIGNVYLTELKGTAGRSCFFAMKVMDKLAVAARKKLVRVQTERDILQCLDHPFLPTLYAHFETEKYYCLVMEDCPGGDLHGLRQRQPRRLFPEQAARFYAAEVILALEYLHMLGIIYRDLKPENVLVREDGHIMLSDFDLSLRCAVIPTLVRSSLDPTTSTPSKSPTYCTIQSACARPATCFGPMKGKKPKSKALVSHQLNPLPELIAEPKGARSMSFVGTHEYLAPEIIRGDGHGSAVDWWTFGIFLYELLFGTTPFKGSGNRATLFNVVGKPLRFPETPSVGPAARDLIRALLVKEPRHRLGYDRGAAELKQHPFFRGVNWALIRCTDPPHAPKESELDLPSMTRNEFENVGVNVKHYNDYIDIEFF